MKKINLFNLILVTLFFIETLCVTFFLNFKDSMSIISIIYTLTGLGIAFFILLNKFEATPYKFEFKDIYADNIQYKMLLSIIVASIMYRFSKEYFLRNPIDFHAADMLPIIKVMCKRFISLKTENVYQPIQEIWGGVKPIYLPALWMPFCLPTFFNIDLRWLSVSLFFLIFAYPIWRFNLNKTGSVLLIATIFILFWWLFSVEESSLLIFTEETVVITFYLLLAVTIIHEQKYLMAIAITLCLLSRYVLIGWIPALIIYSLYEKDWKYLFSQLAITLSMTYILLLYPFGTNLIHDIINLPSQYVEFSSRVWKDAPDVFSQGLGFAKFFGPARILLQHKLLVLLSIVTPSLFMLGLIALKKKYALKKTAILLSSLKFSLVIFYTLIDVPYMYLFYTSSFLTMIILMHAEPQSEHKIKFLVKI